MHTDQTRDQCAPAAVMILPPCFHRTADCSARERVRRQVLLHQTMRPQAGARVPLNFNSF